MSKIELGQPGIGYMKDHLLQGRSLGKALAHTIGAQSGRVFTDVPVGTGRELLYQFTSAFTRGEPSGAFEDLAHFVSREITRRKASLLVEDDVAKKSDGWLRNVDFTPLTFNSELYWAIGPPNAVAISAVDKFLSICYSQRLISSIAVHPQQQLSPDAKLSEGDLLQFANDAQVILVDAYDDTGYIYWIPEPSA